MRTSKIKKEDKMDMHVQAPYREIKITKDVSRLLKECIKKQRKKCM